MNLKASLFLAALVGASITSAVDAAEVGPEHLLFSRVNPDIRPWP